MPRQEKLPTFGQRFRDCHEKGYQQSLDQARHQLQCTYVKQKESVQLVCASPCNLPASSPATPRSGVAGKLAEVFGIEGLLGQPLPRGIAVGVWVSCVCFIVREGGSSLHNCANKFKCVVKARSFTPPGAKQVEISNDAVSIGTVSTLPPEETLYLAERGNLLVTTVCGTSFLSIRELWNSVFAFSYSSTTDSVTSSATVDGHSSSTMSLDCLRQYFPLNLGSYSVYTHLRRAGQAIVRYSPFPTFSVLICKESALEEENVELNLTRSANCRALESKGSNVPGVAVLAFFEDQQTSLLIVTGDNAPMTRRTFFWKVTSSSVPTNYMPHVVPTSLNSSANATSFEELSVLDLLCDVRDVIDELDANGNDETAYRQFAILNEQQCLPLDTSMVLERLPDDFAAARFEGDPHFRRKITK